MMDGLDPSLRWDDDTILPHPSLAVRTFRYIGIPLEGRGACSANSPFRPSALSQGKGTLLATI